jgi:hypothetical protein
MDQDITSGIVYLSSNPAMLGLVTIGKTTRGSVDLQLC